MLRTAAVYLIVAIVLSSCLAPPTPRQISFDGPDDQRASALLNAINGRHGIAGAHNVVADSLQTVVDPLTVIGIAVDEKYPGHGQE